MRRLLILSALALSVGAVSSDEWMVRQKLASPFVDARDAIVMAVENRGLVVNYTSHIGDMLQRTGADIGASRQIYEHAEIIEFCSASLSRKMMEADPHNIVLCPFAISIYTLPGETNTTWIAYRKPQGGAAKLVEPLLREIAAEAGR
ncbi:DUF302 domain-containing protein [Dechloromonas sp. A34]|uniref:DUF302 domain-containing protein n=1 Tax=Dechloromonas sp. A34 TaxID=447588 RepID=UPI002248E820|nr:DUF302 domain-containing protein [Dechloromonas sp. A34]